MLLFSEGMILQLVTDVSCRKQSDVIQPFFSLLKLASLEKYELWKENKPHGYGFTSSSDVQLQQQNTRELVTNNELSEQNLIKEEINKGFRALLILFNDRLFFVSSS